MNKLHAGFHMALRYYRLTVFICVITTLSLLHGFIFMKWDNYTERLSNKAGKVETVIQINAAKDENHTEIVNDKGTFIIASQRNQYVPRCPELQKPTFEITDDRFQPVHPTGYVFSANYDDRDHSIKVRVPKGYQLLTLPVPKLTCR